MWWRRYKLRHPDLSLRTPEVTSTARHILTVHEGIVSYYGQLENVLTVNDLYDKPEIWNMPNKVVAQKGIKTIHAITLSKEMVTVISGGNAAGKMLPPHFKVWDRSVRSAIVSNGFKYTGISPFNPSEILEEAYAPLK
ncbi:hypothetical protein KUTeg_020460, partial [Tegillarca granosa]